MSTYAPGTPESVIKAMDERMYGKPQRTGMPGPPMPTFPGPGGGGSAMEGLGQVDQGGRVIGTALGRAQQANQASSEAIGGGGKSGGFGPDFNNMRSALMKKGGKVKASSASSRGDGIAQRGKTKGRFV